MNIRRFWERLFRRNRLADSKRQLERCDRKLVRSNHELVQTKRAVQQWKAAYDLQRSHLAALKRHQHRRLVLRPSVLRQIFSGRAKALRSREEDPLARAREKSFIRVSSSYEVKLSAESSDLSKRAERIDVAGILFWIPRMSDDVSRIAKAKGRGFPFRIISQTRELALGSVMLDIGANLGRTSIPRAVLGDFQFIYAAEPDSVNYECLVRNVSDNHLRGRIFPDHTAIGSRDGDAVLMRSRYSGGHRLLPEGGRLGSREAVTVPGYTLDSWVKRLSIDLNEIAFVKIDTQGWEAHILSGATRLLQQPHIAWQLEIDPGHLESSGQPLSRLIEIIERHMTHFIDLNSSARGERSREIGELSSALEYVGKMNGPKTDLLFYHSTGD